MFTVAHESPGRLRLIGSALRTDANHAAAVRQRTLACPGVTRALVRPTTGSLIVFHDGALESRDGVLRSLGLPAGPRPATDANFPLLDAVIETTMEKLLSHAARTVLAAVL